MLRYWTIAPFEFENADRFQKVWQYDLSNNVISIGWGQLGDISKLNREQLYQRVGSAYPDKPLSTRTLIGNMLWSFYHDINPGDIIIARKGRKCLAAVGMVNKTAHYSPNRNPEISHPNFLSVEWQTQPRDKLFQNIVFPMHTLSESSELQYKTLLEGNDILSVTTTTPENIEDPSAFVLEKYLEDFIVTNFKSIFKEKLKIYTDNDGASGQQFNTEIGPIDILAVEPETNSYVVIELKKGQPSDKVVGQILRYMGWVKQNLCKPEQAVKGLIICRDPDLKLTYALSMTRGIDVRYYTLAFTLREKP